jgi:tetratricopeptide (TPR) repeat protein
MTSFARALGAARTGDTAGAEVELAKLQSFEDKLAQAKDAYWANQVKVQRLGAAAVVARVQGKDREAVELARAAADLDASMDKHPATPGALLPARELLADLLLELNDPSSAFKEYEQSLATNPGRFRSVFGKARAAKLTGDDAKAKAAYQQLLALCGKADTQRPELAEAKSFPGN